MTRFSETHLMLFMATVAFIVLTMYAVSKMPRWGQNAMFVLGALCCAGGIFFRYGMGLSIEGGISWRTLAVQLLQVCTFNLPLVLLMLVPKFELARQYSIMFSMFAASTTLVSLSSAWVNLNWWDLEILNSWLNHSFAIALPLWMLAAGRLKPQKKYILPVTGCVIAYFLAVYGISEYLIGRGIMTLEKTYSFIYDTDGIGVFEMLYKLIPVPCFYLVPLIPPMLGFFWLLARIFQNWKVEPFRYTAPPVAQEESAETK